MPTVQKHHNKTLRMGKKRMIPAFLDKMDLSLAGKTGMWSIIISVEGADGGRYMGKKSFPF